MSSSEKIRDHLNMALEQLLTAFVINGADLEDDIPTDAIDAALSSDPHVRNARQALDVVVRGLLDDTPGDDRHQAVLSVEEATNALTTKAADAGYRLGVLRGSIPTSRSLANRQRG